MSTPTPKERIDEINRKLYAKEYEGKDGKAELIRQLKEAKKDYIGDRDLTQP